MRDLYYCSSCHGNFNSLNMIRNNRKTTRISSICKGCKRINNLRTNRYPSCKNSKRIYSILGQYKHLYGSQDFISNCDSEKFNRFMSLLTKQFVAEHVNYDLDDIFESVPSFETDHIIPLSVAGITGFHWLNNRITSVLENRTKNNNITENCFHLLIDNLRFARRHGFIITDQDKMTFKELVQIALDHI